MMAISPRQWLIAFVVALAAHLLGAALIHVSGDTQPAPGQPPRGVMVSLEPLSVGNTPKPVATPTPVHSVPVATTTAATTVSPATPTATASAAAPVEEMPAVSKARTVTPVPVKPVTADHGPSGQNAGDIDIPVAKTVTVQAADKLDSAQTLTVQAPEYGQTTRIPNQGSGARGVERNPEVSYIARVTSWLGQHKYYPLGARQSGIQGTVRLYLVINRDGEVLTLSVARSSGHPVLDQAAMQMVRRAEPLPAMPGSLLRTRLEIILPVHYALEVSR